MVERRAEILIYLSDSLILLRQYSISLATSIILSKNYTFSVARFGTPQRFSPTHLSTTAERLDMRPAQKQKKSDKE
jgi:hypothetical protein